MSDLERRITALEQRVEHEETYSLRIAAEAAANRYLLEQLYSNLFAGKEAEFRAFMGAALERSRAAFSAADPSDDVETHVERSAMTLVWMERFRDSVCMRIRQGFVYRPR